MRMIRIVAALLVVCSATFSMGQGFGAFSHKTVTIQRLLPPTVNLNGKRIRVDAAAAGVEGGDHLAALLKTELVTIIQKDPRFIINETSPQTILKFTVTRYYVERWTSEYNGKTFVSYRGKIEVAYQAIDAETTAALDSEILGDEVGYSPAGGSSIIPLFRSTAASRRRDAAAASDNEARDQLIQDIVTKMGTRIAPLRIPVEVPIPGGKLEPLSSLALSGRWGALEEQAQKSAPLLKGNDDTYRMYLIALAKEAQAYALTSEANDHDSGKRADITAAQAEADYKHAKQYLDEAGAIYKQIIVANSKEREFRGGDNRTEEAISIFAMIERYKAEFLKKQKIWQEQHQGQSEPGKTPQQTNVNVVQTPLEQVLDFCSKNLGMDLIKDYIESPDFLQDAKSTGYKFNFAKDPIRLNEVCKQNAATIQRLMRARLVAPAHR